MSKILNRSSRIPNNSRYNLKLRSYIMTVFNYMTLALAITGVISYLTFQTGLIKHLYSTTGITGLGWIVTFAPVVLVFFIAPQIWSMQLNNLRLTLGIYSGLMGLSLSYIFIIYASVDITRVFFITATVFLAMSLYGYVTKRDLTSMASFMIMGLIGVIIASVVNIFLGSPALYFMISVFTVFIFIGLTAYDVQKLKKQFDYIEHNNSLKNRAALIGALTLYMDFINLFLSLLRIFGSRKRKG